MYYPYFLEPMGIEDVFNGKYLEEITAKPISTITIFEDEGIGTLAFIIIFIASSALLLGVGALTESSGMDKELEGLQMVGISILVLTVGVLIGKNVKERKKQENERRLIQSNNDDAIKNIKLISIYEIQSDLKFLGQEETIKYLLKHFYKKNSIKPELSPSVYKKGRSEQLFYNILKRHLGDKISNDHTIIKEYKSTYKYGDSYTINDVYLPDFVYYNPESGICIDIEIDERIERKSGKMIHSKDDEIEMNRDIFFIMNGWFVLRFAEEQILNDTYGCLAYLIQILNKYDPKFIAEERHRSLLMKYKNNELAKIERW